MKRLKDYTNILMDKLYKETGSFFAFGSKQLNKQAVKGVKYVSANYGLLIPVDKLDYFTSQLSYILKKSIEDDIKDNGKEAIIIRELEAHECFKTKDIGDCVDYLKQYNITRNEIQWCFIREQARS